MSHLVAREWPTKRLRFATVRGTANLRGGYLSREAQVTFLPMEAIGEQGELDLSSVRNVEDVRDGYTMFFDGDVVIAKITPCFENGKGALVRGTLTGIGFGTTELYVLTPGPELDGRFLYYLTVSEHFRKLGEAAMTGAAGQKRVPEDYVRDFRAPVLPIELQRTIANYLDRETERLDALVAAKERLLGLLAEKRRALITRVVTKGLNPKAPLRDSGVPWLGEIPAHWELIALRFLVDISSGATPDTTKPEYWDGDIPWVSPKDMKRDEISDAEDHITPLAMAESTLKLIPPGAVLIVVRGMILAHSFPTAVTTQPATINQDMKALRCRHQVYPAFLCNYFRGKEVQLVALADASAHGTRKLETEVIGRFEVCVPPLAEQQAIVAHVAAETAKLDALRAATERTIALLKERRAALIAAAVTGRMQIGAPVASKAPTGVY